MSGDFTILLGTVGAGMFYSRDGGEVWTQSVMKVPVPPWGPWIRVRAVAASPFKKGVVLAGSDAGLYRSDDNGARWEHVPTPADGPYIHIWALTWHPDEPDTIFMGIAPAAIYRSKDAGKSWQVLPTPVDPRCAVGSTHITSIVIDPRDHRKIWAAVEASGILFSEDGGDSWVHLPQPGPRVQNIDIHGVAVLPSGKLLATTPDGVWTSTDEGHSYSLHKFPIQWPPEPAAVAVDVETYCRGIAQKADDPNTIFVATGDYVPGKVGGIQRSTDGGESWTPAELSVTPNSTVYLFATNKANPDRVVAASNYGYVYVSEDAGKHWTKTPREFGEVRGLAWLPN